MSNNQCPECGYPDTKDGQHFKGIYNPQLPCDHCKYEPGKRKLDDIVEAYDLFAHQRDGVLKIAIKP